MKSVKFRAWHKKRKKYYKVLHLHLDDLGGIWATCEGFDIIEQKKIHIQIQPKDCIIEQYTGLKDKNGKEIYEGDAWKKGQYIGIVTFEFSAWRFKMAESSGCYSYPAFYSNANLGEVIGNIHENP